MVAAWPRGLQPWRDEDAERSVRMVQEVVTAVRAVRARYQVPPRATVDVIAKAAGAEALVLDGEASYVRALAGVDTLVIDAGAVKPAHAAVAVAAGVELFVPLAGLVDFEKERARVAKELQRAQDDLAKLTRKLANEGFLAKAAPEVVEKDRTRAAELADTVEKLTAQLGELAD